MTRLRFRSATRESVRVKHCFYLNVLLRFYTCLQLKLLNLDSSFQRRFYEASCTKKVYDVRDYKNNAEPAE